MAFSQRKPRQAEDSSISCLTPRYYACTVSGGMGTKSMRLDEPSKLKWEIRVQPDGSVTIVLSVTAEIRGVLRRLRSCNPSPDCCAQKRVTAVAFALRSLFCAAPKLRIASTKPLPNASDGLDCNVTGKSDLRNGWWPPRRCPPRSGSAGTVPPVLRCSGVCSSSPPRLPCRRVAGGSHGL